MAAFLTAASAVTYLSGATAWANAALQGAVAGMQYALALLRDTHRLDEDSLSR